LLLSDNFFQKITCVLRQQHDHIPAIRLHLHTASINLERL
jgi:hypothetical protein